MADQLESTLKLSEVNASDYDAVVFVAGTGRCGTNPASARRLEAEIAKLLSS